MDVFTNQRPSFLSHILVLVTLGVKYEFLALFVSYFHIIQINLLVFGVCKPFKSPGYKASFIINTLLDLSSSDDRYKDSYLTENDRRLEAQPNIHNLYGSISNSLFKSIKTKSKSLSDVRRIFAYILGINFTRFSNHSSGFIYSAELQLLNLLYTNLRELAAC